ncbi:MAG: DNA adenine methylase [Actinomycetia bacterium]|nr:DNA adenine methylase [Actinomycetes bacterium]
MKAPFPWFGGKRRVAPEVWAALGDVPSYVEPFAGSLAVLLGRPSSHLNGSTARIETVNDADGFVANAWRAIAADPEQVAEFCDWPVNETDLIARHLWLVNDGRTVLVNGLEADPHFFDAKVAGWWLWGIASWIGGGWCTGDGPWMPDSEGVVRKRPDNPAGQGVSRGRPHLAEGQGVNRQHGGLARYMAELAGRLRNVRVCAGDWSRVVTDGALTAGSKVGVFLDPPYLGEVRDKGLYRVDDHTISHDVREWCLANGDNPRYRIVLAGYTTEHDDLIPDTWQRHYWSAAAAYQTAASAVSDGGNQENRHGECLWMSPHCEIVDEQLAMFGGDQ